MLSASRRDTHRDEGPTVPSYTLTDVARGLWVEGLALTPADLNLHAPQPWSASKQTLRGGRRDGVDLVRVHNGALEFSVCPTRGLNLWSASFRGDRVGWRSPVHDGPVNPAFVNQAMRGGLGWLQGFDELMARCGLESNGAPYTDDDGRAVPLHGRVSNLPAHYVEIHVEEAPPHAITVEGLVDESELFFTQLRLRSKVSTAPGSNRLTVRDEVTNLHDGPGAFELLYHWNFGPPHLDEGARFVAPARAVCPRDARAAEGIGHFDVYGPPEAGFAEQVYYLDLHGDDDGRTLVVLRNRKGDKGVALRFSLRELPCFTLWKSTQGLREGYVTGLEPGVNFPNPKPFEESHGRVPKLDPGQWRAAETTLEVLDGPESVSKAEAEVAALRRGEPVIHARPVEPFAPEG
jgi:hypothetical protein